jgi:hypothetical protein
MCGDRWSGRSREETVVPWIEQLEKAKFEARAHADDRWRLRLERVRGKVDFDGRLERISGQMLMDLLEVPQRSRTAGAWRRLAAVMRELGWTPARVRDLTAGGYKEQLRGFCRPALRHSDRAANHTT